MNENDANGNPVSRPGRRAKPQPETDENLDEPIRELDPELLSQEANAGPPPRSGDHTTVDDSNGERSRDPKPEKKSQLKSLLAVVAIAAILLGVAYAGMKAYDIFVGPKDFDGLGSGQVQVEVKPGDNGADISRALVDEGVVASFDSFYRLSLSDSRAQQIQPGMYQLRKQMSAAAALDAFMDPSTKIQAKVTIPEGARLDQIVALVDKNTHISADDVQAVIDDPSDIGLPESAEGNPEGFLFPDTYFVAPNATAKSLLTEMAARSKAVTKELDIANRARALGKTEHEILTIASILEYEGKREEDLPKIARVLYNRLDIGMALQLDSTVSYVSKRKGDVWTTAEERASDSPYNTYKHTGLPPGPIGAAGRKTIEAALNPASGDWKFFFAVTNGETIFNDTYQGHLNDLAAARKSGAL